MSWSPRDYQQSIQTERSDVPPSVAIHDDEPLPTYAAGLERYNTEGLPEDDVALPAWHRLELQRQGYAHTQQLARFGAWMRRGVQEE